MNPWTIAAIIGIGGVVLLATRRAAAAECEFGLEYAFPHIIPGHGPVAIMVRECVIGEDTIWLWDVAGLGEVELGEDFSVDQWPEVSLAFGQAPSQDEAVAEATAWVEGNVAFVAAGGERGPLAQRVEDFLAGLAPGEFEGLRQIFAFEDTATGDVWPYIEQLRTATTDEAFIEIGETIGSKMALLSEEKQDALPWDVMDVIGAGKGLELKQILSDAGVT